MKNFSDIKIMLFSALVLLASLQPAICSRSSFFPAKRLGEKGVKTVLQPKTGVIRSQSNLKEIEEPSSRNIFHRPSRTSSNEKRKSTSDAKTNIKQDQKIEIPKPNLKKPSFASILTEKKSRRIKINNPKVSSARKSSKNPSFTKQRSEKTTFGRKTPNFAPKVSDLSSTSLLQFTKTPSFSSKFTGPFSDSKKRDSTLSYKNDCINVKKVSKPAFTSKSGFNLKKTSIFSKSSMAIKTPSFSPNIALKNSPIKPKKIDENKLNLDETNGFQKQNFHRFGSKSFQPISFQSYAKQATTTKPTTLKPTTTFTTTSKTTFHTGSASNNPSTMAITSSTTATFSSSTLSSIEISSTTTMPMVSTEESGLESSKGSTSTSLPDISTSTSTILTSMRSTTGSAETNRLSTKSTASDKNRFLEDSNSPLGRYGKFDKGFSF